MESAPHSSWSIWISYSFDINYIIHIGNIIYIIICVTQIEYEYLYKS